MHSPPSSYEKDVEYVETSSVSNIDPEEEKKLVRKIDLYILPTMWMMYLLSYMDRTNIGNAKVAGMAHDLKLTSGQYSLVLVVFFIGYVLFEVPSNMVLSRTQPSRYLPAIMFLWGGVTMCMAAADTYKHLIALRVVIGILEAGFAPGVLLLLSSWYKRSEQSRRFAVYISAAILSGAFGGLLAGLITSGMNGIGGLAGWRWLFIIEGLATSCWAVVASFILPNFPATSSKKFTQREIDLAIARLATENVTSRTLDGPKLGHLKALKVALSGWRTWLFTAGYMVIVGSSTLSYFYPTLVQGLGYSGRTVQYMTVPIYAVAFVCTAITGIFSDRVPTWRGVIIAGWLSVAFICSVSVTLVYGYTARYALLVIMAAGLWSSNALALSFASSTFGALDPEVRAIGLAFVNAMGNLAQIYGAYLFPSDDAPKYILGFGVISGMCGFGVCVYIACHILTRRYPTII